MPKAAPNFGAAFLLFKAGGRYFLIVSNDSIFDMIVSNDTIAA